MQRDFAGRTLHKQEGRMGSIMVVDTRGRNMPKAAELLVGHTVTVPDDLVVAEKLPEHFPIDLILFDCIGPGCLPLIQTLRARSVEARHLGVVVVYDPLESETELDVFSQRLREAGVLNAICRGQHCFCDHLNFGVNVALFDAWLLDYGPQVFPFARGVMQPNPYTRFFRKSYFARFIRAIGGWEALKQSADWATLRDDPAGRSNVIGFLHHWGKILSLAPERFWLESYLITQADESIDPVVRAILSDLAEAISGEQFICIN